MAKATENQTDAGTEMVVVRSSTDLAQISELENILLSNEVPEVVDDPEQLSREIIAQMLAAESDAELEQFGTATGWRELEGVPVRINGFTWRPSDFDQGSVIYFVVRADRIHADGQMEPVVLTTGSRFILAQLTNMARRGTLVGSVRELVRAERATRGGFYPLRLRTPEGFASPNGGDPAPDGTDG